MGRHRMQAAVKDNPIQEMWIDSPLTTYAQLLHEIETGVPHPGRHKAMVDKRTLLGGFCRFHGSQSQNEAAAKFKSIYERAQVGGAKAVDPEKEPVDGGGINPESVITIGADARQAYIAMQKKFGHSIMRQLEFVIIGEKGPTAYARWLHRGRPQSGQVTARCQSDFRRLMDEVAVHLKLQTRTV
jgi:hypothetical protein